MDIPVPLMRKYADSENTLGAMLVRQLLSEIERLEGELCEAKGSVTLEAVEKYSREMGWRISEDAHLVEAWLCRGQIIVLGEPPENDDQLPEDEQHNCDAMGCGSLGPHVIARFDIGRSKA